MCVGSTLPRGSTAIPYVTTAREPRRFSPIWPNRLHFKGHARPLFDLWDPLQNGPHAAANRRRRSAPRATCKQNNTAVRVSCYQPIIGILYTFSSWPFATQKWTNQLNPKTWLRTPNITENRSEYKIESKFQVRLYSPFSLHVRTRIASI